MIFLKLQLSHLPWVGPWAHSEQLFIGRDSQGRVMLHNESSAASEADNQDFAFSLYCTSEYQMYQNFTPPPKKKMSLMTQIFQNKEIQAYPSISQQ